MEDETQAEDIIVRYLLGLMTEPEREHFEANLCLDPEALEELGATEDELIESYLAGALSDENRQRFETYFLRDREHKRRLGFALSFESYLAGSRGGHESRAQPCLITWCRRLFKSRTIKTIPIIAFNLIGLVT